MLIGCHTDDLSSAQQLSRAPVVTHQCCVDRPTESVSCLWGGLVYVIVPKGSQLAPVSLTITSSVPAPYYRLGEWVQGVREEEAGVGQEGSVEDCEVGGPQEAAGSVSWAMSCDLCSIPCAHVLCPIPHTLTRPVPYALCPLPSIICPVPSAPCPVPCALCPEPVSSGDLRAKVKGDVGVTPCRLPR